MFDLIKQIVENGTTRLVIMVAQENDNLDGVIEWRRKSGGRAIVRFHNENELEQTLKGLACSIPFEKEDR